MFFILGIENAETVLDYNKGFTCPVCGGLGRYQIKQSYSQFNFFFHSDH